MITCGLLFHSFKEGINKKKRNPREQRLKNTPAEDAKQANTKTEEIPEACSLIELSSSSTEPPSVQTHNSPS